MLLKNITYTDYNGAERTEEFRFNLNEAEVVELELSAEGGITNFAEQIVKTQNGPELIALFKKLIMTAYGEKSLDGRRFVKSEEVRNNFMQTEAYSKLFMELATNSEAAVAFFNGIIPQAPNLPPKS